MGKLSLMVGVSEVVKRLARRHRGSHVMTGGHGYGSV